MPAQEEQSTAASELNTAKRTGEIGADFSPDLIEERNKANTSFPDFYTNSANGQVDPGQLG